MNILKKISTILPIMDLNLSNSQSQILLELGSQVTRVIIGNQKMLEFPTLMAIDSQHNTIAIGNKALGLKDKAQTSIQIIKPLQRYSIFSRSSLNGFLDEILNSSHESIVNQIFGRKMAVVSLPYGIFPLHKQVVVEELRKLGISSLDVLTHSQAAYYSLPKVVRQQPVTTIFVGGSSTEVVMIDAGKIIAGTSIPIGSIDISEKIKDALISKYQLAVSDTVLVQIKKSLPTKLSGLDKWKSLIRGKDIIQNLPISKTVGSEFLMGIFDEFYEELVMATKQLFAQLSSELVTHTLEKGIYVFGKESQLPGAKSYLEENLNSEIFNLPSSDLVLQGQHIFIKSKNKNA